MINAAPSPARAQAMAKTAAGASWFTAIAAFSVINAIVGMIGLKIQFIIGLALCEIVDVFGSGAGAVGKGIAFVVDLVIAGVWLFFAAQGRKGRMWAFIVGMILYAIDGILFLVFQEWLAVAFHAYVLFRLFIGLQGCRELSAAIAQENQMAAYVAQQGGIQGGYAQPGQWPPAPGAVLPGGPPPPQPGWPQPQAQQPSSWPPPAQPQQPAWPEAQQQPQQPAWPQAEQQPAQPGAWPPAQEHAHPAWPQAQQQPAQPTAWPPPAEPNPAPEAE